MERIVPGVLVTLFAALVLGAMVWAWRARRRRQSAFGRATDAPAEAARGRELARASVLYVATTAAGDPLNRLTIPGLAFRGRGVLTVLETGLSLVVPGEPETFIARERLRSVGTSTWTIDRVVEPGGLVRIDWTYDSTTGPAEVESYVRATDLGDAGRLIDAAGAIIPNNTPQGGTSS
ncbi:hypothetical protein [Herbiconiux sp. VKM Ac-2851]|uniref:PH-like domain-containing protein n=1 Tax=Herbiconiux sp. VKM Ac-2851 TaxID=2739025 RepID=UPI0015652C16|nr:hypothetical protein [Herbiconiux sp. VKM Ac-2851]NQX33789.1 hypothetical protein [Herbiconiux sp. VKM Ac-2851]